MAKMEDHMSNDITKMLLVGDSGAGKTSALAGLANAGFNVRILDFDNGLDTLRDFLEPDAVARVSYVTLRDSLSQATAWVKAMKMATHWKDGDEDLGKVKEWGSNDVLVVDSLTFAGKAALNSVMQFNRKKLSDQPGLQDWGQGIRDLETFLQYLTSDDLKCNVIVNTHITQYEDAGGITRGYPTALGSKLPTYISRYFNMVLRMESKVVGRETKRTIRTVSDNRMDLKNVAPKSLEAVIESDLAKVFEVVRRKAKGE